MKAFKVVLIVLVGILLAGLGVGVYMYQTGGLQGFLTMPGQPQAGADVPSVVAGSITAISGSTLSVQTSDGVSVTVKVTDATRVESLVGVGETGKTLSQLAVGTMVAVILDVKDSKLARIISVVPEPPTMPAPNPDATPAQVVGVVTDVSSNKLTLTDTTGNVVEANIPSDVTVLTRVVGGESGKTYADIAAGDTVQVSGLTSSAGFVASVIGIIAQAQ